MSDQDGNQNVGFLMTRRIYRNNETTTDEKSKNLLDGSITKAPPCNIQGFFTAVKMTIFS